MNSAIKPNTSGMFALIGKSAEFIDNLIVKNDLNIQIANDNSPMQVVISGLIEDLNKLKDLFLLNGLKKYVKLNVSSAFHSKYMQEAQDKLKFEIDKIEILPATIPIISNYNAEINLNSVSSLHSKNSHSISVTWNFFEPINLNLKILFLSIFFKIFIIWSK